MGGDWGQMNSELLHLISKKLGNLSNLIRFRSVCKEWRLAADPADLPARLPCLLQPDTTVSSTETNNKTHDYLAFSVCSNKTRQIKLPISHEEFKYQVDKVPFMGFLLIYTEPLFLFNPLTETKLHFPFPKATNYRMVYMGPNPNSNSRTVEESVLVVVLVQNWTERPFIAFWRSNKDKITIFRFPINFGPGLLAYYKGKLFVRTNPWDEREETLLGGGHGRSAWGGNLVYTFQRCILFQGVPTGAH